MNAATRPGPPHSPNNSRWFSQLRRDLGMLADGFRGRSPAPFQLCTPPLRALKKAPPTSPVALKVRDVEVVSVEHPTADSVCIGLRAKDGLPFEFYPGQFLTVRVELDGVELRRAYSVTALDAMPGERSLTQPARPCVQPVVQIVAKRVPGGRVSNHLNECISVGDTLSVLGPSGAFGLPHRADSGPRLVFFAGGSGITPIFAMVQAALLDPAASIDLIYGNRSDVDIIFAEHLRTLEADSGDRLRVHHVLEDLGSTSNPITSSARTGRVNREIAGFVLGALTDLENAHFFVCGPDGMMREVRDALGDRGVPPARIVEERFAQPHLRKSPSDSADTDPQAPAMVEIGLNGKMRPVKVLPGQTLLEAALASGVAMPYSCALGGCGACRVKVRRGEFEMEEPNCLTEAERADGFALACIGRPRRHSIVEVE